ncbi:MAG: hypothetical protein Q8R92_15130 [Deltaproteobacteria bacterium]|nr:hypothetical protein [Deltaproteobacteria bacterium]
MQSSQTAGETAGLLTALRREAAGRGLDLVGVVDAAAYDRAAPSGHRIGEVWPGTGVAVVIGSAGPLYWSRFRVARPGTLPPKGQGDPLDDFTIESVAPLRAMLRAAGYAEQTLYPFFGADHALSFRALGSAAGFGAMSVLGLVIHPAFGPWIAARAAILTDAPLEVTRPLDSFDPCRDCPAPCIAVCPGGAFPEGRWAAEPCLAAKRAQEVCRSSCLSRIHCVYGEEYQYGPEEMAYYSTYP